MTNEIKFKKSFEKLGTFWECIHDFGLKKDQFRTQKKVIEIVK